MTLSSPINLDTLRWSRDGLIPVIVQDSTDGAVLMMAWMNREALEKTLATREMHYWSRSRGELWHKGMTSGNTQRMLTLVTDCDQDALLATVAQQGSACHTGKRSCFFHPLAEEPKK